MEEPGYQKAAVVFQNSGIEILTVPVDENGMIVDTLPDNINVDALYTTPSHKFPTGVSMPIGRRVQSIDEKDRVIYLGTFSKALSPTLRMGYFILPPKLLDIYYKKLGKT